MKTFCTSLREHVKNEIDFEKKKMLSLTKIKITPRCDRILNLWKKILKKVC